MALNFSSCSVFSTPFVHTDDESSRSRCERSPLVSYWDTGSDYGYVEGDSGSTDVEGAFDPVDLLPDDPFGMGLDDSMGVAIASLLEVSGSDFFGWTLLYSPETQFYHDGWMEECDGWDDGDFTGLSVREAGDEILESGLDMGHSLNCNRAEEARPIIDDGTPHEGLLFSLGYLGVRDLLSVEGVCRSLRFAVQSDTLLWRCIHIDSPLSEKITDDVLLRLTQRAQGNLQCLSLTGCSRITDDGLKRVLDNNPRLRKLSVPGCVRLSLDGIINSLKVLQSQGMPGIEHLKLGRLFIVSEEQYGELKLLLGAEQLQQAKHQKPRNTSLFTTVLLRVVEERVLSSAGLAMFALRGVFSVGNALKTVGMLRHFVSNIYVQVVGSYHWLYMRATKRSEYAPGWRTFHSRNW